MQDSTLNFCQFALLVAAPLHSISSCGPQKWITKVTVNVDIYEAGINVMNLKLGIGIKKSRALLQST